MSQYDAQVSVPLGRIRLKVEILEIELFSATQISFLLKPASFCEKALWIVSG